MTTRIPNLLHLILLLALTFFALVFSESVILILHHHQPILDTLQDPRLGIIATILTYLVALLAAWFSFPLLWHRPFLTGIHWNPRAARPWLILAGIALGFLSQAVSTLLPTPTKDLPEEALFHNPALIWILVLFGTFIAPLFEEIVFRGFLLPGIAILVDYVRLPRSLEALELWRASEAFSLPALIASSIVTSIFFAAIHGVQLGWTWPNLYLLFAVSLILCYVRIRFRSVAASTVIHTFYNLSVFITLFITTGAFRHLDRA